MRVAVVGAGVTGLSAGLELQRQGIRPTIFEAADRVGGVISTVRRDGFLVETGPTSLLASAALENLVTSLGLASQRLAPRAVAQRRFIVRNGALVALPGGPGSLLTTKALSAGAKLSLLGETFVRARRDSGDESIAALIRRRLDQEILDYLVDPMIAGIHAGDLERLSVRHAMPLLHRAERQYGSLLLGSLREMRATPRNERRRGVLSFVDGLEALPRAMAAALGDNVRLATRIVSIERRSRAWRVRSQGAQPSTEDFDAVLAAVPAHALPSLGLPSQAREALGPITNLVHAPIATLALGFRREDVLHPLDAFGLLTPRVEHRYVLGALFSSSVFSNRAPAGHILLTAFLGGMRAPERGTAATERILPEVLGDLGTLLGLRRAPVFVHHQCWPRAIPQYELGHELVDAAAADIERALPGLYLTGQWRAGVSLGACIAQGRAMADRLLAERRGAQRSTHPSRHS